MDEYFPQEIFHCYTHEQIMDAVFEKFDAIYDNDEGLDNKYGGADILRSICSSILIYSGGGESFQRFREQFNRVRPRHAERFLKEMDAYPHEDEKPLLKTLREDMKKWGKEEDSEKEAKVEEMVPGG